jgi:hypothetical protein
MRTMVFLLICATARLATAQSPTPTAALRFDGVLERAATARKRNAGIALIATGAAANVAGLALWSVALHSDTNGCVAEPLMPGTPCARHDGMIVGGLVTAGIGLATLGAGVVLFVIGVRERRAITRPARVAVGPGGLQLSF